MHRVLVTPASGAPFEAARKRLPARPAEAMQLFAAEVEALKAGRGCRNVVQILDVRCTPEYNEILLELLKGGTLADELVRPGFTRSGTVHHMRGGGEPVVRRWYQSEWAGQAPFVEAERSFAMLLNRFPCGHPGAP